MIARSVWKVPSTPKEKNSSTRSDKKSVEKKPVKENKPAEKADTANTAKKADKSKTAAKSPALYIQSLLGNTITAEDIFSRIPSDADSVYVKPGENKAYWVRGEETGSVDLW